MTQLRSAVSDMQTRLKAFAETASVDLEGLGAAIDLETHSISEILSKSAGEQDSQHPAGRKKKQDKSKEQPAAPKAKLAEKVAETVTEPAGEPAEESREAAYLQQPRGQRPWERG